MSMTRRKLILAGASGSLLMLGGVRPASAVWPVFLRFVIGGAARRSAGRAIASSAARGASSSAARRAAVGSAARTGAGTAVSRQSMMNTASLNLARGIAVAVSPEVYALAQEHNAEAIWIQNGYQNEFEAVLSNTSSNRVASQLYIQVEDVITGHTEKQQHCGLLSAGSEDVFRFSFTIAELPYSGVKRIAGRLSDTSIRSQPSGNIVVASSGDVAIE